MMMGTIFSATRFLGKGGLCPTTLDELLEKVAKNKEKIGTVFFDVHPIKASEVPMAHTAPISYKIRYTAHMQDDRTYAQDGRIWEVTTQAPVWLKGADLSSPWSVDASIEHCADQELQRYAHAEISKLREKGYRAEMGIVPEHLHRMLLKAEKINSGVNGLRVLIQPSMQYGNWPSDLDVESIITYSVLSGCCIKPKLFTTVETNWNLLNGSVDSLNAYTKSQADALAARGYLIEMLPYTAPELEKLNRRELFFGGGHGHVTFDIGPAFPQKNPTSTEVHRANP